MAQYRLYCLDGASKVASAEWFEAEDDEVAVDAAKDMLNGYRCELWQGRRLVERLNLTAARVSASRGLDSRAWRKRA